MAVTAQERWRKTCLLQRQSKAPATPLILSGLSVAFVIVFLFRLCAAQRALSPPALLSVPERQRACEWPLAVMACFCGHRDSAAESELKSERVAFSCTQTPHPLFVGS